MENHVFDTRLLFYFVNFITNLKRTDLSYCDEVCNLRRQYEIRRKRMMNRLRRMRVRQRQRRRRVFIFLMLLLNCQNRRINRRIWARPRQSDLWNDVHLWSENEWIRNIRMSQTTFEYLCEELGPHLARQRTKFRAPVPVGKRIMVGLWRLATNIELRSLGLLFGIGRSTACEICNEFVRAVVQILTPVYIRIPNENIRTVVDGFRNIWNFPQCGGAIDGTHIPIIAPSVHHKDYFNRKGWHSIITQAVVDHEYKFMDIAVGSPGSNHDAYVLRNSGLFRRGMAGNLFSDMKVNINGVEVPIFLIGDPAYPLMPWLMKGFPRSNIQREKEIFNNRLSIARMVVENAFGRLKGRWRCLLKRHDGHLDNCVDTVSCCCTLHNICEVHKDQFRNEWLDEIRAVINDQPNNQPQEPENNQVYGNRAYANNIRLALLQWVTDNP